MTIERNYDLLIAVDEGYSGSKITINGIVFEIPEPIVEITGRDNFIANMRKAGYICTTYLPGEKHLVGEQARMLLKEPEYKEIQESKKSMMDSYHKFTTQDSEIHLMTCIAMALIKYANYTKKNKIKPELELDKVLDEKSPWNIYLILGYPNDVYDKVFRSVKPTVVGRHNFTVETEHDTYALNFAIKAKNVMTYSQAIAAYMGLITDDNGDIISKSEYLKCLPMIVIDGGQKTVGIYKITANMQIEAAESNTDYAMNNVYERVVKEIHEEYGRRDIEIYNIEEIIHNDGGQLTYIDEKDVSQTIDIRPIVDKHRMNVCAELIEYLNKKFNKLQDINGIAVAGGTGVAYYESMTEYITTHRPHLSDTLHLMSYEFMGRQLKPVFAVSAGLYKVLKRSINQQREDELSEEE